MDAQNFFHSQVRNFPIFLANLFAVTFRRDTGTVTGSAESISEIHKRCEQRQYHEDNENFCA